MKFRKGDYIIDERELWKGDIGRVVNKYKRYEKYWIEIEWINNGASKDDVHSKGNILGYDSEDYNHMKILSEDEAMAWLI